MRRYLVLELFNALIQRTIKKRSKQIINGLPQASRPNICIEHSELFKDKQKCTCIICDSPLYFEMFLLVTHEKLRLTNGNTMQKLFTKMKFKVILKFLKVCSFFKKPEMFNNLSKHLYNLYKTPKTLVFSLWVIVFVIFRQHMFFFNLFPLY